jgi:secreted trypsin-like serine protease
MGQIRFALFTRMLCALITMGTFSPLVASQAAHAAEPDPRIIAGTPASTSTYPWMAALLDSSVANPYYAQFCGGSLIDASWVLTAAHCVEQMAPGDIQVVLGHTTLSSILPSDRRAVARIFAHERYHVSGAEALTHDVALLKLASPAVGFTPIAYNTDANVPAYNASELTLGWGRSSDGPNGKSGGLLPKASPATGRGFPDGLLSGSVTDFSQPSGCVAWGSYFVYASHLCAESNPVRACAGDSGGPLFLPDGEVPRLVGVVSFGHSSCLNSSLPTVHSRVSAHASWIANRIANPNPAPSAGYRLVLDDGAVIPFGDAPYYGGADNISLNKPVVSMAGTPSGLGYWLVAGDGGVFGYGDATFYGSTGNIRLNRPVVGMTATPSGHGYWFVAADGGIFGYGDATFYGSTGNIRLNKPIVGMTATPSGHGYWLVASDGGIFGFGDASFYGSTGNIRLNQPIVGMSATPSGHGYWLVASDGGIFGYGDASFYGSTGAMRLGAPVIGVSKVG